MALIVCTDCGNQVSDAAPMCPGCGRPFAVTLPAAHGAQRADPAESAPQTALGATVEDHPNSRSWLEVAT